MRGNYALNGNPLERNGFSTYMYETTRFDNSDFGHVTVSDSMILNTGVKADVELAKNGCVTITIPEDADITITGNFTVDGYVIDTSSYYRGYPAYLYLDGTLRVTGNFAVGNHAYFYPSESAVLYVGGNYYVSNYGTAAGTVIFNGAQKQTSSLLCFDKVLIDNASADGVRISSMICTRLFDHRSNVFTITDGANCADYDRDGVVDYLDPEPTLKAGCVVEDAVVVYENGQEIKVYSSFADALVNYDSTCQHLKLTADLVAVAELTQPLYIDLAGFDLSGILYAEGNPVFLFDSETNRYTCDRLGYFTCTDEKGNPVVPQFHWRTDEAAFGSIMRYITLHNEAGYSAHRFYLGLTHITVKPGTDGMGYRAVFAGDDMVLSFVEGYGFTLALGNYTPKTLGRQGSFVSGKTVTLRIDNYDVASFAETPLSAQVFLMIGGETISSDAYSVTLREAVESVNKNAAMYSAAQLNALKALFNRYPVMLTWKVADILALI